jgi:hypothetical protein
MRPMGGIVGGCPSYGGATEHQQESTPHLHGQVHVACAYQYNTLKEIADMIKSKELHPEAVKSFQQHLHREDPPSVPLYEKEKDALELAWYDRFRGQEHNGMATTPYILERE